jgi:hypothetical protein
MPHPIDPASVDASDPGRVTITGDDARILATALVQKQAITLVELVEGADRVVRLSEIEIGTHGEVILKNKEFRDAVASKLRTAPGGHVKPFWNVNCTC